MRYRYVESPIGELLLAGQCELRILGFAEGDKARRADAGWCLDESAFTPAARQLAEYFDGSRTSFDLPLEASGTPFQRQVWAALQEIPYGETCAYADIAERIGRPKAVRAVGAANGSNPLPIIVPCHRVIGRSGQLTGFGGGLPTKAFLLELESRRLPLPL